VGRHASRSNAIIAGGLPARAVLAVLDDDSYVSPDWYEMADQVPTWNYIAVHLRGELVPLPPAALEPHLNALSDNFESRLLPKPVWRTSKMSEGVMERMVRMILPFRLNITAVAGTWKLGQNKPTAARQGVIAALEARGPAFAGLAQRMRDLRKG
jgi:transcriptional regulator